MDSEMRKEIRNRKHKLIHTDNQTHRQTDGRTDRQKSFIDMKYYTEQYSKSN